jgi:valyl-tRNA synthetase
MIMAGYEYQGRKPFNEVYFTGIVRDKLGRKMSKSLGNSPDLLALIDQYGADAVRFGILISSPAGNDLLWDESSNEQGSFFINKMWNALKLVKMWEARQADKPETALPFAVNWFEQRLHQVQAELDQLFREFRLSEALKTLYSLIWDDFCSWYLEWVKPAPDEKMDPAVYEKTLHFYEQLVQLLHPFMPFVTEEIYHQLRERQPGDDLTIRQLLPPVPAETAILEKGQLLKDLITGIRDSRNKQQLKPKEKIRLFIQTATPDAFGPILDILSRQVNAESLAFTTTAITPSFATVIGKDTFYLVTETPIDTAKQKEDLEKELVYQQGFLAAVDKKLSNEKFVANAKPEVVEIERRKKADAEARIKAIQESLGGMG